MKTVILFGSPRKDGNTHALVDVLPVRLREKRHEVRRPLPERPEYMPLSRLPLLSRKRGVPDQTTIWSR